MKVTSAGCLLLLVAGQVMLSAAQDPDCGSATSKRQCRKSCGKGVKSVFSRDGECNLCTCCPERYTERSCQALCEGLGTEAQFLRGKNDLGCKKTCKCLANEREGCDTERTFCKDAEATCLGGYCHVLRAYGDTCSPTLGPINGDFCQDDLACIPASEVSPETILGASGHCGVYLPAGEDCLIGAHSDPYTLCQPGTKCVAPPTPPAIFGEIPPAVEITVGTCVAPAGLGEACDMTGPLAQQTWCLGDLQCHQPVSGEAGVCRREVGLGNACKVISSSVKRSVYCYEEENLRCHFGRCQKFVGAGQECTGELPVGFLPEHEVKCEKPLRCLDGVCFQAAAVGEACQLTTAPQFQTRCKDAGARCVPQTMALGASGICMDSRAEGKKCDLAANKACDLPLECVDGRCKTVDL